jgi:Fe-S cluster biogenesis protein NfuA
VRKKVEDVFTEIRAILRADGSDIELVEVGQDGIVKIRFIGVCGTCGGSMDTLRKGVERMIKEQVLEVREVVVV